VLDSTEAKKKKNEFCYASIFIKQQEKTTKIDTYTNAPLLRSKMFFCEACEKESAVMRTKKKKTLSRGKIDYELMKCGIKCGIVYERGQAQGGHKQVYLLFEWALRL